ncbi:DUF2726 domain-containing protein [Pseudoalteromonas luteoviolacea]|uniref:DUF2726 domain-containing protein n=1 Tax=Pseudoalteromonas luteoviolacea TaxID=43657 RepID=UPI001B35BABF|nr:DUF2726 domain-containing protein [Pseudoalteromonas luteoviolacea]MBQ4840024.1 DUF2726 domain-containing protein [Pseudoalteromonas luteoviolacea]
MEDFYNLMQQKKWKQILANAKSQQHYLKNNKAEWLNICNILQGEFIRYSETEKPVLVSSLCFEYIKLNIAGYIELSDESAEKIENIGIRALIAQDSTELAAFAKICRFAKLPTEGLREKPNNKDELSMTRKKTQTAFPRTDWLTPLFKSTLESHFYQALKEVFPTFFIYPNVAISNIFDKESIFPYLTQGEKDFYFKGVVDFVVYDPSDEHIPKYFFEVDSFYHDSSESFLRDNKKNGIFKAASITLHRIRLTDSSITTKFDFITAIKQNLIDMEKTVK